MLGNSGAIGDPDQMEEDPMCVQFYIHTAAFTLLLSPHGGLRQLVHQWRQRQQMFHFFLHLFSACVVLVPSDSSCKYMNIHPSPWSQLFCPLHYNHNHIFFRNGLSFIVAVLMSFFKKVQLFGLLLKIQDNSNFLWVLLFLFIREIRKHLMKPSPLILYHSCLQLDSSFFEGGG